MTRVAIENEAIAVPTWVVDLESFRRWCDDDDFPESGQFSFLRGEVWIDMSKEQLYSHNRVKTRFTISVGGMIESCGLGIYFSDGAFLSNVEGDVSNQPDGMFVSFEALRDGRVKDIEGRADGFVELEGSPDMVLEVVSQSSIEKDNEVLREAYFRAGVREYWLVDARKPPLKFDIFRHGATAYEPTTPDADGYFRSEVFNRSFRLVRGVNRAGVSDRCAAIICEALALPANGCAPLSNSYATTPHA